MRRPARLAPGALAVALALAAPAAARARSAEARPAPAEAPASNEARGAPRVRAVELVLPPGDDSAAAGGLVAIETGAPLSPRTLRRTVQRLYQTGRYRNVLVRAAPDVPPPGEAGEWVRVVVEALPVRVLARILVTLGGPGVDAAAVRTAAGLATGQPFDESDLAAAAGRVRAALSRRGFRGAEVEPIARGDLAVEVELRVRPGDPVRVRAVRLAGDPGPAAETIAGALRTRAGAVLDDDVLDADVRRVRAALHAAGHRRSRVGRPVVTVDGALADVELPVEAGPRLSFVFRGNAEVPAAALRRELGFEDDQPVDPAAVAAAAERLVGFYRARGYASARVDADEVRRGRDLAVVFHVDEGCRYRLGAVRFEGAVQHDERFLRERLAALLDADAEEPADPDADRARALAVSIPTARVAPGAPPALAPHEAWNEETWDRAADRLVEGFRAEGFLEAVSLGSTVAQDRVRRVVDVTLHLREGPRTTVESISFEGNEAVSLPELAREARLAPGDALAFERVEATRAALLRVYLARGFIYARVDAREDLDAERHVAAVRFVVSEGPRVRIGRIVVTGNRRTRGDVVRDALAVSEGAVYDPEAVARSQSALLRLGVFRSVSLRVQDPEVPQQTKDLAVEVAERPWATLTNGFGFSIANGPRAFVEWEQPNLLGRALEFSARAKVNYPLDAFRPDLVGVAPRDRIEGRADVGVRSPTAEVLGFGTGERAGLVGEILHRKAYDLKRVAAVTGVDVSLAPRIAFSLAYELELDRVHKSDSAQGFLTQADVERLRFDEGDTTLHALRPSITADYRDSSTHPRRGWLASGTLEWAESLGEPGSRVLFGLLPGSDIHTNMLKAQATASGYLPVGTGTVVALSLRGGRVFPLDPESTTIVPKRFFLGGATTMRGFAEEEMIQQDVRGVLAAEARHCAASASGVGCTDRGRAIAGGERPVSEGGEAFVLAKAELRMRLRGSLEGGLFVDVGNLWLDPRLFRLLDLRPNVGAGLRFVTPIGPAVLDLGFNTSPDEAINERTVALHFTIGLF